MKSASEGMKDVGSLVALTSMMIAAVIVLAPMIVVAPPTAGDLDVRVYDIAPATHTFPGDSNVTMLWIEMMATGGAVRVTSLDFSLGGSFSAGEVSSVALWDDSQGISGPDKLQGVFECELTRITNPTGSFALPTAGSLNNCNTPFGNYIIPQFQTRYILVFVSVSPGAAEGSTISIDLVIMTTDAASINGDSGSSSTVEVLHIFFSDDMESGQGGWTTEGWDKGHMHEPDGLWHQSSGEENCKNNMLNQPFYQSPTTGWWYGHRYEDPFDLGTYVCSYYTHQPGDYLASTRNMGNLTTPTIDARTGSSLAISFRHMLAGEPDTGLYKIDNGHMWLFDGTMWFKITPPRPEYAFGIDNTDNSWWKEKVNLSDYAGKQVQIELRFDTVDTMNNVWLGWFVDDLVVYGKLLAHDIHVNNNDALPVVAPPGNPLTVSAQYNNIGSSDETNIGTKLTVDNSTVDTGTIASLLSGTYVIHSLTWGATTLGSHWICMVADPVTGETELWNNKDCVAVTVGDIPAHYIYVVRSQGTSTQAAKNTWDYLNANWQSFGGDQVIIDYSSLDMSGLDYATISGQSPKPDTLVISSSGGYINGVAPPGGQFTDVETAAIEKYTLEGHGLILTGTVFNALIPNNNDLTGLVGIADQAYARYEPISTMDIESSCTDPLVQGVSDPFSLPFNSTMTPSDNSWTTGDISTGVYCARSPGQQAAIVINKGVYMISFAAERTPNNDVYRLLYNAMVNAQYQVFDHDVKTENIVAPNYARVGYPVNVSATVKNIGKNNENVDVKLLVNTVPQDSTQIFLTATGGSQRVTLSYTPSVQNDDNVCIRADIIGFTDQDLSNNEVCKIVKSMNNPPVQVFVLDSWGTDSGALAPWSNLNAQWSLYGTTPVFIDWTTFNKENIQYQELVDMNADVLLISNSYSGHPDENPVSDGHSFSASETAAISSYVNDGHGLIVTGGSFDTNKLPTHVVQLGPLMGIDSAFQYMTTYRVNDMQVQNPAGNHPLFYNINPNYNTRNGTSLTPGFIMTGAEPWAPGHLAGGTYEALESPAGPYGAVIAHEPGTYNTVYITNFVERMANTNDKQLLYNAMVWARSSVRAPSNLWVQLWNSDKDLRLTWTENPSTGLVGYNIYRANTVDTFTLGLPLVTVPAGTTEYIDLDLGILPGGVVEPNNYYYIVRAYDSNGNEEMNMNMAGKFIITLYPKTNEISLPFVQQTTTTSVVFSQLTGKFDKIEAFDAQMGVWKTWTPTGGTLTDVDHTMGLRVTMKPGAGTVDFISVGQVSAMTDISLYQELASEYWNFVGFPRHLNTPLPDALDNYGMAGRYDLVLWYDPLDKKQHWKWFNPNDPGGSPLTELRPGMGIWVHTTLPGIWSLPGS
ncbi:MAG: hypothetical protein KAR39_11000 [Thermoplasmata archaeon]|nr:hypothetical protein [Thermoplasmata archaeon]